MAYYNRERPYRGRWWPEYEREYGYDDYPWRAPYVPPEKKEEPKKKHTYLDPEKPTAPPFLWDWIKNLYGQGFDPKWVATSLQRLKEGTRREEMGRRKSARESLAYQGTYRGGLLPRAYERAADVSAGQYALGSRDIYQRQLEEQQRSKIAAIQAAMGLFGTEAGYGMDWLNWLLNEKQLTAWINQLLASY